MIYVYISFPGLPQHLTLCLLEHFLHSFIHHTFIEQPLCKMLC